MTRAGMALCVLLAIFLVNCGPDGLIAGERKPVLTSATVTNKSTSDSWRVSLSLYSGSGSDDCTGGGSDSKVVAPQSTFQLVAEMKCQRDLASRSMTWKIDGATTTDAKTGTLGGFSTAELACSDTECVGQAK